MNTETLPNTNIFLNIIILYNPNPNYTNQQILGATIKSLSLLKQFHAFYLSIKKNLKIPHQISIIHNNDFSQDELRLLNNLDVDLLKINEGLYNLSDIASRRYIINTRIKGTHRLIAETDMLMLQNPEFDWNVDFQFGYGGSPPNRMIVESQISRFNLKTLSEDINWNIPHLFREYMKTGNHTNLPPGINNGLVLIKEEMAIRLYDEFLSEIMPLLIQEKFDKNTAHFIGQWMMGPILITLSDNWKPFPSSINYLLKEYDVNEFGKDRIQLLHYCGVGAGELVKKHFKEYLDSV